MRRVLRLLLFLGCTLALTPAARAAENPYQRPMKAKGFTARAVALPARSVGETVLRTAPAVGVEILIQVEDYLPRGLEPTLLIDGKPAKVASGVRSVQARLTTLGFLIESPGVWKEGATLALQMGDDKRTRASVPGTLHRKQVRPLDQDGDRGSLPALPPWLQPRSSKNK